MKTKIIAFTVLLLSGPIAQANPNLIGAWQTGCTQFTKHSLKTTLTLTDDRSVFIIQFFSDAQCKTNSISFTYDGVYSTGGNFGDGTEINLITSSIKYTLRDPDVVERYNNSATDGCAISDWKIDLPREVSGRYCRPTQFPQIGQTLYDIFRMDGNKLKFGGLPLRADMTQPSLRPSKLNQVEFNRIDGVGN